MIAQIGCYMISVGYYYTGNKNYIDKFKDCELIILIDDESYVDDLIKYNLNIKIIKYDDSFYDIVFSENDNLENINANKKIVIGKFEKHKTGIQYIEEFDLKEILKMPEVKQNKFSIIVPNFNNGDWIDKTIESVINQTYENWEMYIIDDMSTDNSVEIAYKTYQKYLYDTYGFYDAPNYLKEKMKVVQLKQKRYNGGARNEAYLHLSDDVDYVYYVDSDDWLYDENVLEEINNKLQSKPDVLFVGIAEYKKGKTKICDIPEYKDKYEAIAGWSGSCGKVIKKNLATRQGCLYNEGTLKEDKNQHCKICIYMNNFQLLKKPVYVWNKENYKSVTTVRTVNPLWETSTIRHYADTMELYLREKGKDEKIDKFLESRLQMTKKEVEEGKDRQW